MKKIIIIALMVLFVAGLMPLTTLAQKADKADDASQDKVQRAGGNVILGWTEIPKTVAQVTKDTDNPFLGITVGLVKGVLNGFARTVSGVADVVTMHKPNDTDQAVKDSMVSTETPKSKTK